MSEKIGEQHLARHAILYVRQSSQQQLVHNEESRRQQYAMRGRLRSLGWADIEVIDEDLGKSAAGSVERSGFRRLVADVSLGQIGAVAAREVSRPARNSRDWQQLIEICRVVDTVLVDHDSVYAPRLSNDRLLLGLKGSLNEYELELLRMRGQEARRQKAERGELIAGVPVGYRVGEDGLEKTPDARVRQVIELIFSKFFELGSARQVMLWMRESGIQAPVNRNRRGDVVWKDVTSDHIYRTLGNPLYAGAYAYGRTKLQTRVVDGQLRPTVTRQPRDQWPVLLRDRHEAYISWEQFERAGAMLLNNAQRRGGVIGAARGGPVLLSGIAWCRRCGHRLRVGYSGKRHNVGRYKCDDDHGRIGGERCISFSATDVDAQISEQVLAVLQPGAINGNTLSVLFNNSVAGVAGGHWGVMSAAADVDLDGKAVVLVGNKITDKPPLIDLTGAEPATPQDDCVAGPGHQRYWSERASSTACLCLKSSSLHF